MAQYAQSQPFSFFGYPESYSGGYDVAQPQAYAAPVSRYEEIMGQNFSGGGGRGMPSDDGGTFTEPTSEQAYNVSQLGKNLRYISPLTGLLVSGYGNYLASQVNPNYSNEGRNYPAPTGGFLSSEAAPSASTGTLSFAPPTEAQYGAYLAGQQADAAGRQYGTGAVPPGVSANQFAANYAAYNNPNAVAVPSQDGGFVEGRTNPSSLVYGPNPSLTASIAAQAQAQADASAAAAAQAAAQNYSNEGRNYGGGGRSGDGGGVATGGNNGDASGGGDRGTRGGFAQGGHVSMQHLGGPDPEGPDDGYAALKDGEFVINDKAVKKYGIELMNAINSGKISKGKLRGLLEM
jgi:hypothetical protein